MISTWTGGVKFYNLSSCTAISRPRRGLLRAFGGTVTLQELTGMQAVNAARWSLGYLGGAEGLPHVDTTKREALQIALGMVEPSLGDTDEAKAAKVDTILQLGFLDQLLLSTVQTRLREGTLTDEQQAALKEEQPTTELLEALGLGTTSPEAILETTSAEDLDDLLRVALRVPAVLSGSLPMTIVHLLAGALKAKQVEFAAVLREGV